MSKIKLVLVDDELTSRNTIKKFLENNDFYEVIGDFSNGKVALDWIRKNDIDILLCDMQMPDINGVELIRNIHIINEYLPVIAISGFDNFEFVRGSLINGATNYILKHELTKEKLIEAIDQVVQKYKIVSRGRIIFNQKGYCIYDEKEFNTKKIEEMVSTGEVDFYCYNIIPIVIGADYKFVDGINPYEYRHDICKAILDMLNQILGEKYKYLIHFTKDMHLIILLSFSNTCSRLFMINTISNLTNRLQRQIIRMLDITITIVNGEVQKELTSAIKEAKLLDDILKDKLYLGGNRIIMASNIKKLIYSYDNISENLWKQLEFELINKMAETMDTLNDIFEIMKDKRYIRENIYKNCRRMIELVYQNALLNNDERKNILDRIDVYEIFEDFKNEIFKLYDNVIKFYYQKQNNYSPLISQAVEYIYQKYTSDISLEKCSELTKSSYTYLSREFKKETGMRFVEFLNNYRVNKAKSLLIRKEISMKEIVQSSGFRNYNYFFKVFKEIEGITPSEFLAKN